MPTYRYTIGTRDGKVLKGQLETESTNAAVEKLRKQGYFVLQLTKTSQIGPIDLDEVKKRLENLFGAELSSVDRMMFTQHLASMLKTGVPIVEAIGTFIDTKGNPRKKHMFERIIADLEGGTPLSTAFSRFPKTFSSIYTHIVSSGESTGTVGETLTYLADQLRRDHQLTSRVKGAMIYPAVVLTIMIGVIGFIMFSVVPKLLTFAQNVGHELPFATKALIAITSFFTHYSIAIIFLFIVFIVLINKTLGTKRGREINDQFLLRIPLIGELTRKFHLARFSRLLGAFYHYGIALPTALSILESALPNVKYQQASQRFAQQLSHGLSLSAALDQESEYIFPKLMVRVIRSAEKSATVDDALWRMADYYEEELEETLKNLTTIIEPILILILGIAVVGIAMAVIVPIYQISTSLK